MSFDLIKDTGEIIQKSGAKALEVFCLGVGAALILLFGDRAIDLAVVGLEAGVSSTLEIRGSQSNEVLFLVDGISFRDDRNNKPITTIPLSAVQEISIQSGGFGAEYSNVRSGVVNVVTKEGDPNRYEGAITFKTSPAQPKHFGMSPFDPNSYWLRPYLDPEVSWVGTKNGPWDQYTQNQYAAFHYLLCNNVI